MGSEVVVTYKRKRLFSRSDHPYTNLHSEISKPKASEDFCKHVGQVDKYILQNKDPEVKIFNQYSNNKVEENVLQCGNCDSHSEKNSTNPKVLCSAYTDQIRLSPKSVVEKTTPNVLLKGSSGDRSQNDSASQSFDEEKSADTQSKLLSMKLGSECELETSDGINCNGHIKGSFTSEETNKLDKEEQSGLYDNLVTKRKLTSALITFCRRSKRSRGAAAHDNASESKTPSCSVEPKEENVKLTNPPIDNEEKKPTEDIDKSAPAPATAMVTHTDNPLNGEAKNIQTPAKEDSCEEMPLFQEKVVQDNCHIDVGPKSLSNEDVKSRRMLSDVSEKRDSKFSLDLSVSPCGARDIDCNRPLDCGSDENHPLEPSEVPHDFVGSTRKLKEKMPTLHVLQDSLVRAASDKGKFIVDSQPVLTGTSSKSNCMQLFPENPEKAGPFWLPSLHPPNFHGLSSLQPEHTVDNRVFYPAPYQWPQIQAQPKESFHNFLQPMPDRTQSFSRQKMMLDNILTRARAVRGNQSSFLDRFDYPNTWSEEELDSLWIGVRRHGRGNWDAIVGDRRLHFSPWKTTQDLADRWQEEQAQLFCTRPVSQLHLRPGINTGPSGPVPPYSYLMNGWSGPLHPSLGDESSSNVGPMTGGLPHWLRAAVEVPPKTLGPTRLGQPGFEGRQPWLNSGCTSGRKAEPQNVVGRHGKTLVNVGAGEKGDELIIIPSDASSEETISDDHS